MGTFFLLWGSCCPLRLGFKIESCTGQEESELFGHFVNPLWSKGQPWWFFQVLCPDWVKRCNENALVKEPGPIPALIGPSPSLGLLTTNDSHRNLDWGKDWTSKPKNEDCGAIPNKMEICNCHQQLSAWNLGGFQINGESQSERQGDWLWVLPSASSISSGQNPLPAHLSFWVLGRIVYQLSLPCPVKKSQLIILGAQTKRDLPMVLRNGEFLFILNFIKNLFWFHHCHQPVKKIRLNWVNLKI